MFKRIKEKINKFKQKFCKHKETYENIIFIGKDNKLYYGNDVICRDCEKVIVKANEFKKYYDDIYMFGYFYSGGKRMYKQ